MNIVKVALEDLLEFTISLIAGASDRPVEPTDCKNDANGNKSNEFVLLHTIIIS
jgi:hypothetical protein